MSDLATRIREREAAIARGEVPPPPPPPRIVEEPGEARDDAAPEPEPPTGKATSANPDDFRHPPRVAAMLTAQIHVTAPQLNAMVKEQAELLHNAFVGTCLEIGAGTATILLALEMLRDTALRRERAH